MLKVNYIRVTIPQQFDFKLYGIDNEEAKLKFLKKMCEDSINKPIIQNDKAIGVITDSEISSNGQSITFGGKIWCNIVQDIERNEGVLEND